jgi:small subunit ribosomal protein S9
MADLTLVAQDPGQASWLSKDTALDEWGTAMDEGNWDRAWDIFESQFPVDTPGEFPTLEELLAWDPDAERKKQRRDRELALQEQAARGRVREVDSQGRSHAVGRRKTSVARVWVKRGVGSVIINRRQYDDYFRPLPRRNDIMAPFIATETLGLFDVMASVHGGGVSGQSQAVRHGVARALQLFNPSLRPALKATGLLTRDPRAVERKKPGRKKARKSFQWVKR